MFAILRGANGRRHEVDLKDDPVIVDVSTASVQIATRSADVEVQLRCRIW